jgi:NADPH-dependent 2,4-dienoyl-CoA reductase/sulfur reductase-like enzyme
MSASTCDKVVIVGGGQAGGRAAIALRHAGFAGQIVLVGAEPHLPYERPPLSKALLLDAGALNPQLIDAEKARILDLQFELGVEVAALDRAAKAVQLQDGRRLNYDRLLLANGCRVRRLSLPGLANERIHHLRTIEDARGLEARLRPGVRVAVVGGGFIGLEAAAAARVRGCEVAVVEMADRLLPRLRCLAAGETVRRRHEALGVRILCGVAVERADNTALLLSNKEQIQADVVIAGIGVQPDIELARRAGLEVGDGVLTDEFGRTSDPDIFAAGDVACQYHPTLKRAMRLESWQNANQHADAVARGMMGHLTAVIEIPWVWSDQGSVALQIAGAPNVVDEVVARHGNNSDDGEAFLQFQKGNLVGGITVNRGKEMPIIRRWLTEGRTPVDRSILADASVPLRRIVTDEVLS